VSAVAPLAALSPGDAAGSAPDAAQLALWRAALERLDAPGRVAWALENLPGAHALSSSFGAQAAVSLHMATRLKADLPVVLVDTGYLFPETYQFIDALTERLELRLHVCRAPMSAGWQEARYGRLWEQGLDGIERYNRLNKVEPMNRALDELGVSTWIAGLRRAQASTRQKISVLEFQRGRYKLHPLFDWTDRDVFRYLSDNCLPYHPLWEKGYVSIGDWHTTRSLAEAGDEESTRFFGLKRECGLHDFEI
jgi:phosphoadenosine phosphosulfate reductase